MSEVKYPSLTFNGTSNTQLEIQKNLGMFLVSKLDLRNICSKMQENVLSKVGKRIGLLYKP